MTYPALEIEFEFRNRRFQDAAKGLEYLAINVEKSINRTGPVLRKQLREFLNNVAEALAQRHGKPYPQGTTDNTLSKRSGQGIRSIKKSVTASGSKLADVQGSIGGNFVMRVHEKGATIRAKKAKFLTIPLPAALNSRGIPRKMSAREWDKTFIATSKNGNLIIFRKNGRKITPLYVLKKEVKIKPRLKMEETLKKGLPRFVDKAMDEMLKALLEGL